MKNKNIISCDVINDLLPLYLEGVCSEDTKKIIEGHLEECDKCSLGFNSAPETDENMSSVSGFKRIKKRILIRNLICVIAAIVVTFLTHEMIMNVGSIYNFFYTDEMFNTVVESVDEGNWLNIGDFENNALICRGNITNYAGSSGGCELRIIGDDTESIVEIAEGKSVHVKLKKGVMYNVEIRAAAGHYCIHID